MLQLSVMFVAETLLLFVATATSLNICTTLFLNTICLNRCDVRADKQTNKQTGHD